MPEIPDNLRKEAGEAFLGYEGAVVNRLLKRPGWKLDAGPLERVLATGDERQVREFIDEMRRERASILNSIVV